MEFFLHDGDQNVHRHCDPYLGENGILGGSIETFDSQMLLEPSEEELHLPTASIQFGDRDCRYGEVVGQEGKAVFCHRINEFDKTQFVRIVSMGVEVDKNDGLIATESGCSIHRAGVESPIAGVGLDSGDKKGGLACEVMETFEVEITPVEDVKGASLDGKQIQSIYVVNLARSNVHPAGDVSPQVEQGMGLDCSGIFPESRPREKRQTETDGCGVEGISRVRQIDAEAFGEVEFSCLANQYLGKVCPDSPVAMFVGMCQSASGNRSAHAHVIEFALMSPQTAFDIPQSFPVGELGKSHTEILIHTGEGFGVSFPIVLFYAAGKLPVRNILHHLRKDRSATVHRLPPFGGEYSRFRNSNRFYAKYRNYQIMSLRSMPN